MESAAKAEFWRGEQAAEAEFLRSEAAAKAGDAPQQPPPPDERWLQVRAITWAASKRTLILQRTADLPLELVSIDQTEIEAFGRAALHGVPPEVLQASPEGCAVLKLMASGTMDRMVAESASPEAIAQCILAAQEST